jgi:hypothetical protein
VIAVSCGCGITDAWRFAVTDPWADLPKVPAWVDDIRQALQVIVLASDTEPVQRSVARILKGVKQQMDATELLRDPRRLASAITAQLQSGQLSAQDGWALATVIAVAAGRQGAQQAAPPVTGSACRI